MHEKIKQPKQSSDTTTYTTYFKIFNHNVTEIKMKLNIKKN